MPRHLPSLRRAAPALAAALAAAAATAGSLAAQAPDTEIFLAPLRLQGGQLSLGEAVNVTGRPGYDNQPSFTPDGRTILYTSQRDGQTDVYRYEIASRQTTQVTSTPESEYSPAMTPDGRSITVVRVEADSTQRLWRFATRGNAAPQVLLPDVKPVGYFAWADERTLALFVLGGEGRPNTLQVARTNGRGADTVLRGVGRSLHRIPGTRRVSFLHSAAVPRVIVELDPATGGTRRLVAPLDSAEDMAWANGQLLLMARGRTLFQRDVRAADGDWMPVGELGGGAARVTRLAVSPRGDWLAFVADMPRDTAPTPAAPDTGVAVRKDGPATASAEILRRHLSVIADDSMQGRLTGTAGIHKAARYLAEQFQALGLQPAGDSTGAPWAGYLQRVPLRMEPAQNGGLRPRLSPSLAALDTVAAERRVVDANVVAMIPGSDPALRDEVVLVTAHYDHVGVGRVVEGDSIYNGADDDGSGTVAMLEIARLLQAGPAPKRTVIFAAVTGEERGLLGTNWYLNDPVAPLERTVANLNLEMLGRPDTAAGGPGKAWLTGYERSTMGDALAANGVPIVPDPRPAQNFFQRSDNYAFALRGIPAHTLSSFGLHPDYHRPSDEVETIDFAHMAAVTDAAAKAVRLLTDGPKAEWKPGGRPEPRGNR